MSEEKEKKDQFGSRTHSKQISRTKKKFSFGERLATVLQEI